MERRGEEAVIRFLPLVLLETGKRSESVAGGKSFVFRKAQCSLASEEGMRNSQMRNERASEQ